METKVSQVDGVSYARYELHRQIYSAEVYPFSAPNGSKIVVCGHEQGILLLWRGGRAFKAQKHGDTRRSQAGQDVDMEDEDEFEATEPEHNNHSIPIVQKLDLYLGTAVLKLSFPPLPHSLRPQETPINPTLLQTNMVVSLACADNSIRLLTVPLKPPSPSLWENKKLLQDPFNGQTGKGFWGESMVTIPNAHQNIPRGIAMTFASRSATSGEGETTDNSEIDAIIASHSADLSGVLLVHRIPVQSDKPGFGLPELWRVRPLSSPAHAIDIFVPTNSDVGPRILIGESSGVVRIFECISEKHRSGKWSLSLFPNFANIHDKPSTQIFSVKWVLGGRAIAVLIADGIWGIWDISNGGSSRGLSGARPTAFTISGRLGKAIGVVSNKSSDSNMDNRSQLAPMTPGIRKVREGTLFSGKSESNVRRGGMSVSYIAGSLSTSESDEPLIFWYGNHVLYLPSLRTHWQNKFKGASSVFTTSASGHIRDIPSLNSGGEARISVSAFTSDDVSSLSGSRQLDTLVAGDRSLVMSTTHPSSRITPSNLTTANQSRISDQSLLSRGLLDVNGLDRMLDGMDSGRSSTVPASSTQKRVLFQ